MNEADELYDSGWIRVHGATLKSSDKLILLKGNEINDRVINAVRAKDVNYPISFTKRLTIHTNTIPLRRYTIPSMTELMMPQRKRLRKLRL